MDKIPTKRRILNSALDLFSERGYDGVGVDLIAENAGIKGPSLYRHFKGKEDILLTLVEEVMAHYETHFGSAAAHEKMPESLDQLIEQSIERLDFTVHDPLVKKIRKLISMEQFRNPFLADIATKQTYSGLVGMHIGVFDHLIQIGQVKEVKPSLLAFEFVAPVSLLVQQLDREPNKEAEIKEMMLAHFSHFKATYSK